MKQRGRIKRRPIPYTMRRQAVKPNTNIIVKDFHGVIWQEKVRVLPAFTIFYNPADFPGKYVVRLFDGEAPTKLLCVKSTLEEARAAIPHEPPIEYINMGRHPEDDPVIVEVWM